MKTRNVKSPRAREDEGERTNDVATIIIEKPTESGSSSSGDGRKTIGNDGSTLEAARSIGYAMLSSHLCVAQASKGQASLSGQESGSC